VTPRGEAGKRDGTNTMIASKEHATGKLAFDSRSVHHEHQFWYMLSSSATRRSSSSEWSSEYLYK